MRNSFFSIPFMSVDGRPFFKQSFFNLFKIITKWQKKSTIVEKWKFYLINTLTLIVLTIIVTLTHLLPFKTSIMNFFCNDFLSICNNWITNLVINLVEWWLCSIMTKKVCFHKLVWLQFFVIGKDSLIKSIRFSCRAFRIFRNFAHEHFISNANLQFFACQTFGSEAVFL